MSGFRDYQSVIQAGVRRGEATRRVPLDPGQVRAVFGPMVRHAWTATEIDLLDRAARAAMLEPGPAAQWQVTGEMSRRVIDAGPRSARRTGSTG